jgi:pyruvate,water dikinase
MYVRWFKDLGRGDVASVGGKNASLGEMVNNLAQLGVRVPDGFAVTSAGYRRYLEVNALEPVIRSTLSDLDPDDIAGLKQRGATIRAAFLEGVIPDDLAQAILVAYRELGEAGHMAVRSSATAEDLPSASFAGQQESFLHVCGSEELLDRVRRCYASLFTDRAISYREKRGFDHLAVALSAGVQQMVNADRASSGVIFTLDPESGFRDVIYVTASWGLGENIVQGRIDPDAYHVHKPTLAAGFASIVGKRLGQKELRLVYDGLTDRLENEDVARVDRDRFALSDEEVLTLSRWSLAIEAHYGCPMDIEWAKAADSGELFIVQARPETVHSQATGPTLRLYHLRGQGERLVVGLAVGSSVASGRACLIHDPSEMKAFQPGDVLVTEITDPDWEPLLKQASAVITERGGRTSHAAIVARELGVPAVVGAANATRLLSSGEDVTVSCAEGEAGIVYRGRVPFEVEEIDTSQLARPQRTQVLMNLANPELAYGLAQLPCDGVGLARMEFIYASWVKVHPLALTRFDALPEHVQRQVDELVGGRTDRAEYLIEQLTRGVGTLAAAFYPRPVILRFSDFKSNEYAHLLGGSGFEPDEENPMLGWRGASRYYHPEFKEGFLLEVEAVKRVRERLGLTNLKVMVPFCRTPDEGRSVLAAMAEGGLVRGENGLEVYVMAEIPANVLLADRFAEIFDGFSIGSNDLTQLVLGVDRDSDRVAPLFDERNEAVKRACRMLLETARASGTPVGICGQAPSDYPDFAAFLVEHGIHSVSLTPDSILATMARIVEAEQALDAQADA